jgi:hypothetical protein
VIEGTSSDLFDAQSVAGLTTLDPGVPGSGNGNGNILLLQY